MDSAVPMLLFLGLLTAFGVLVLACGMKSCEEEREAQEADPRRHLDLLTGARFFAAAGERALADPVAVVIERGTLERLEAYLCSDLALAEVHVAESSLEQLQGSSEESRESLLHRLEGFLIREQALVADFVSNPSIAKLYESTEPVLVAA